MGQHTFIVSKSRHWGKKQTILSLIGIVLVIVMVFISSIFLYNVHAKNRINHFITDSYLNEKRGSLKPNISASQFNYNKQLYNKLLKHFRYQLSYRYDRFSNLYDQQTQVLSLIKSMQDKQHIGYYTKKVNNDNLTLATNQLLNIKNTTLYTQQRNLVDNLSSEYKQTNTAVSYINKIYDKAQSHKKVDKTSVLQANAYEDLIQNWSLKQTAKNKIAKIDSYSKLVGSAESEKKKKAQAKAVKAILNKPLTTSDYTPAQININKKYPNENSINNLIKDSNVDNDTVAIVDSSNSNIKLYQKTALKNDPNNIYQLDSSEGALNFTGNPTSGAYTIDGAVDSSSEDSQTVLITDPTSSYYGKLVSITSDAESQKYLNESLADAQSQNQYYHASSSFVWLTAAGLNNALIFKNNSKMLFIATNNQQNNANTLVVSHSELNTLSKKMADGALIVK